MSDDGGDYEVGYGKPPKHTRFKPGQSGNPKGRPKGVRNLSKLIEEELSCRVSLKENGRTRHVTKQTAFVKSFVNYAVKGEPSAQKQLLSIMAAMEISAEARKAGTPSTDEDLKILQEAFERLAVLVAEPQADAADDPGENTEDKSDA